MEVSLDIPRFLIRRFATGHQRHVPTQKLREVLRVREHSRRLIERVRAPQRRAKVHAVSVTALAVDSVTHDLPVKGIFAAGLKQAAGETLFETAGVSPALTRPTLK